MTPLPRILITGHCGFFGSWLITVLRQANFPVWGLDRREDLLGICPSIRHDLLQPCSKKLPAFDVCIHLATSAGGFITNATNQQLVQDELLMLTHLKQLCDRSGCGRLLYTSTMNVFELSGVGNEDKLHDCYQKTPYARAKALAEAYIESTFKQFTIIRATNFFGPEQARHHNDFGASHVIPDLIEKIRKYDVVEVFGNGLQYRNFLHLYDLTTLILRLLPHPEVRYLHARSELFLSIQELVQLLMTYCGLFKPLQYRHEYMQFEPVPLVAFACKQARALGWYPEVNTLLYGLRLDLMNQINPMPSKSDNTHTLEPSGLLTLG